MLRFDLTEESRPLINFHLRNITSELFNNTTREEPSQANPTPEHIISNLQRVNIENNDDRQCSICFEQLNGNCIQLRCDHYFHENCISRWLNRQDTCPVCRNQVYDPPSEQPNLQDTSQRESINIVQRTHMLPNLSNISNSKRHLHFIFSNGQQLDTIWNVNTKAYELLSFLEHFNVLYNTRNIKIKYNLSTSVFTFSSQDSYATLNTSINELLIPDHCIMRVYSDL